jgi:hypothetical protein
MAAGMIVKIYVRQHPEIIEWSHMNL